jgi:hypothetical protein
MGRGPHELEKRDLAGIVASLRANGDHVGLLKLFAIFAALRDAAQNCDSALVNKLSRQLDQQINRGR